MAPVSSLGAVVSWEEDMDSDGEAKAVLGHSTLPVEEELLSLGHYENHNHFTISDRVLF
jgi:hypothetical protein